jgi:hypothetical protein
VTPVLYVLIASAEDRFRPNRHNGNGHGDSSSGSLETRTAQI